MSTPPAPRRVRAVLRHEHGREVTPDASGTQMDLGLFKISPTTLVKGDSDEEDKPESFQVTSGCCYIATPTQNVVFPSLNNINDIFINQINGEVASMTNYVKPFISFE
ncbi:hypothetical protein GWI33_003157 [Rhynchophorus ferrugineus]|uniref:Uncharacterized protein n=1 Tax=Rhynchophorus ferrugineus TaxID=354439 RepID=A0A834MN22_RHYFE|nr:hypothetical protein GWI33_003157 [Rhynchophorus ferrugineus]